MKTPLATLLLPLALCACGTEEETLPDTDGDVADAEQDGADTAVDTSPDSADTAVDTSPDADAAPGLSWYLGCGDPVCSGHTDRGVPACTGEAVGATCAEAGATCDPIDDCNALLVCAGSDPRLAGCPISRRSFKRDIHYLTDDERTDVAAQVLRWPLATWRYAGAPGRLRMGFVLEDLLASPAADPARDQVDLYAALSMAIAALQVQAEQIATLQSQVAELQERAAGSAGAAATPGR